MGPVVDPSQLAQDLRYLDVARNEGGEVVGGEVLELGTAGHYLSPALVLGTKASDTINREEVFGPVVSVIRVADYDEALATANASTMNLSAGIVHHRPRDGLALPAELQGRHGDGEPADRGRGLPRAVRRPRRLQPRTARAGLRRDRLLHDEQDRLHVCGEAMIPPLDDIFTEPQFSTNTLANLGPLAALAGVWEGTVGQDVNPKADGPEFKAFHERFEAQPMDPQTNGPQLLYGLRYHMRAVEPGQIGTFHDQVGYLLWPPATSIVTMTLAIPRAQVAMASGTVAPDAKRFTLRADVGDPHFGICTAPFPRCRVPHHVVGDHLPHRVRRRLVVRAGHDAESARPDPRLRAPRQQLAHPSRAANPRIRSPDPLQI